MEQERNAQRTLARCAQDGVPRLLAGRKKRIGCAQLHLAVANAKVFSAGPKIIDSFSIPRGARARATVFAASG